MTLRTMYRTKLRTKLRTVSRSEAHCRPCSMVSIALVLAALGMVSVFGPPPRAAAQPPEDPGHRPTHAGPPQDVVDQLLDRGFQQIQPSIFERAVENEPSSYETVVYGIDGHLWLLGQQEAFLQSLEARYERFPAPELLDAILSQQTRIAETLTLLDELLEEDAGQTSGASSSESLTPVRLGSEELISMDAAVTSCSTSLQRAASADPSSTGPTASGSAGFSDTCTEIGTVSSLSLAQGTDSSGNLNTFTQDCPSVTGGDVSCDTAATVDAVSDCFASGQSTVTFGAFTHTVSETTQTCRMLSAGLTGTTNIFVPLGSTVSGSWSVSVSDGESPFSYQWLYNNAAVGADSPTYSRSYTHPGTGFSRTDSVKVTVSDSSNPSQTVTETMTVQVVFEGFEINPCLDPCGCSSVDGNNLELEACLPD